MKTKCQKIGSFDRQGHQSGGATVEFVAIALVLIPMLVLMPSLAKNTDVRLATTQAARYGAWEMTVQNKGSTQIAAEINNRFYAAPKTSITTGEGTFSGGAAQNAFWGGVGLGGRLVEAGEEGLGVTVSESSVGGRAGDIEKLIMTVGNTIGSVVPDSEWDLGGGVYTVNVGREIQNSHLGGQFSELKDCAGEISENTSCLTQRSAILVDSWGARNSAQVERRVRSLVPAGALQPLGDAVAQAGVVLPLFQELEGLEGSFGAVDAEHLPEDRYGKEAAQ